MRSFSYVVLGLSLLQLTACASSAHCQRAQDYQSAQSRAPLIGTDGLAIKESAGALRIPPPVENPVEFGEKNGSEWSCLDMPPRLVLQEDKPKS